MIADSTSGAAFTCTGSTIGGSLANVTNAPLPYTTTRANGNPHSITSLSFSGCTASFGTAVLNAGAANLPDDFVFTGVSTTQPQAAGFVRTTGSALLNVAVLTCSFNATGSANITWTNGTSGQLEFVGSRTLHPSGGSAGCFGRVSATDTLSWTGTYTVTPTTIMIG